ncbi:MAG: hypothetical protein ACE5QW_05735 [Thermoplasmata archaeon]
MGKITCKVDSEYAPDGICVEMDLSTAKRLTEERTFSPFDLLFVKYRNIQAEDVELARALL